MAVPLPAATDVTIRTTTIPATLFTVRTTQNVGIAFQKNVNEIEEIGERQPYGDDIRMITQIFKVRGFILSTAGASPELGDDDLFAQYNQFITALDTDDLLEIRMVCGDGSGPVIERGHFKGAELTLQAGDLFKWGISFDFVVLREYYRL